MKQCFKCNEMLPLSEFYAHPMMADGYVNKCKECNKKDVQANYRKRHDQYRKYDLLRKNLPHRQELKKRVTQKYRSEQPTKYKAHAAVGRAVREGKLQRGSCERCGSLRVHGHHEDYSKPLEVMWLCPLHHKERHAELKEMGVEP